MLTPEEQERYDRQIMMPEIGREGQEKLKGSRVLIAGVGGLGSSIAFYLTAAGIGRIRLVDHDSVSLSNLNRQILHWEEDIGKQKVDSARDKLKRLNHHIEIETVDETLTEANISFLAEGCHAIVDAMDNLPTRYLLNYWAIQKNIPLFHGAVQGFEGRVMTILPGKTACLRCMYRGSIPEEKIPVIGVTPAIIGCVQATEVIKYILGIGRLLTNRLLLYDGRDALFTEFAINRNPECDHCGTLTAGESFTR